MYENGFVTESRSEKWSCFFHIYFLRKLSIISENKQICITREKAVKNPMLHHSSDNVKILL
jgi:hypothetical protein